MDTLYWLGEYGKVLCAFVFLMFVWPSVVFSSHLRKKGAVYRFGFCVTVQVVLVTAVVLLLGVCHILHGWIVVCLFYGAFAVSIYKKVGLKRWLLAVHTIKKLLTGTHRIKSFMQNLWRSLKRSVTRLVCAVGAVLRPHLVEYAILGVLVVYGMIYFSYGVFQNYGYGFGDMYVHNQWIDAMLDGDIFYAGIYPRGMHCVIYSLHTLFGIRLYNCIQLLAGVQIIVTLVSIYIFLRSVFRWKYTPLFVLALFLFTGVIGVNQVYDMSRLQWAVPQEYGMYTQFLSVVFLDRYLRSTISLSRQQEAGGCRRLHVQWNADLFIFMLSILAATIIHFYCTILALMFCVPFALCKLKDLLNPLKILSLVIVLMFDLVAVALPMAAAYASGVPLQGSLRWAMSLMDSADEEDTRDEDAEEQSMAADSEQSDEIPIGEKLMSVAKTVYWRGYAELYRKAEGDFFIRMSICTLLAWGGYRTTCYISRRRGKTIKRAKEFDNYPPLVFASVLFMLVYVSLYLGLPQLVSYDRVCSLEDLLLLAVAAAPADMFFALLSRIGRGIVLQIASVAAILGVYVTTMVAGFYHGYLLHELTRYNAEVVVANSIIENFPPNSYTIVSTTSELYQVNRFGRHEELLRFVREIDETEYYLPTEYIFLFIEKHPLDYAQPHFYLGPAWLANNAYPQYFGASASLGSEANSASITVEAAREDLADLKNDFDAYRNIENRTVVMSKTYLWCQNFMKLFPNEVSIYYEDDDFVCYCIRQNPESLYDLAIENWESEDGIHWAISAEETIEPKARQSEGNE